MACDVDSPNVQAFLKLVRYAEHYPDKSDNFYDSLYGGGRFTGYASHPHTYRERWGHRSDAAGAYQILGWVWDAAKRDRIVSDFTPASQDKLAFEKLKYRRALDEVCRGELAQACVLCANEWTALPGGKQSRMTMAIANAAFVEFGGKLS